MTQTATASTPTRLRRWPILLCLGLVLAYPFYSVAVQRSSVQLAPELGVAGARAITEGAVWLYPAVVLAISMRWERRSLGAIGLRRPTAATLGFGLGGAAALLVAGQIGAFIGYTLLRQHAHSNAQAAYMVGGSVVYALFLAVRAGVVEELLFRGLAIEQLTTLTGNRLFAAGISMMVFILVHRLRFDAAQLIPISTVSIVLTGLYLWRRDLFANMIAHTVLDAMGLVAVALPTHAPAR